MFPIFRNSRLSGRSFRLALLIALFVAYSLGSASFQTAHAQSATTGAISGTVTDTSGALLPGVTITVTSVDTGVSRIVKANRNGEFTVDELRPVP
jgi:hypothetical protein